MPRTVVPPVTFRNSQDGQRVGGDGFPVRLVKYVPAETLAFFVPISAAIGRDRPTLLTVAVVVGLIGTIGYLWAAAQRIRSDERPLSHFYVLAGLAFLCWSIGTSQGVANLLGLDHVTAGVVLGFAVFLIPLADEVAVRLRST